MIIRKIIGRLGSYISNRRSESTVNSPNYSRYSGTQTTSTKIHMDDTKTMDSSDYYGYYSLSTLYNYNNQFNLDNFIRQKKKERYILMAQMLRNSYEDNNNHKIKRNKNINTHRKGLSSNSTMNNKHIRM